MTAREPGDLTSSGAGATPPKTPRWAKVGAAIAVVVLLLIVALLVLGGGKHGPGRHVGGGASASSVIDREAQGVHNPPVSSRS